MNLCSSRILLVLVFACFLSSCAFQPIRRTKDITFVEADSSEEIPMEQLNVFSPKKSENLPVMVFFYGGSWESGRKEIYDFLGSRMARKEVVTVIVDYPLSPEYQIESMVEVAAKAVVWTKRNIQQYGGDPNQIFVSGHSAGGHLASLLATKDEYFEKSGYSNPIKGAILIDPAGLDMHWFLSDYPKEGRKYLKTFTEDPAIWKEYSPIYFLEDQEIPMLILEGERTYPSIQESIKRFRKKAEEEDAKIVYKFYEHKKHIPMITQFLWTGGKAYEDVLQFIENESSVFKNATSF